MSKVKKDPEILRLCSTKVVNEEGSSAIPQGRRWDGQNETDIEPGDDLKLMNINDVRSMKGDSIATTCNTNFESQTDSSDGELTTKMDDNWKRKRSDSSLGIFRRGNTTR